jgi:hypothetical protein
VSNSHGWFIRAARLDDQDRRGPRGGPPARSGPARAICGLARGPAPACAHPAVRAHWGDPSNGRRHPPVQRHDRTAPRVPLGELGTRTSAERPRAGEPNGKVWPRRTRPSGPDRWFSKAGPRRRGNRECQHRRRRCLPCQRRRRKAAVRAEACGGIRHDLTPLGAPADGRCSADCAPGLNKRTASIGLAPLTPARGGTSRRRVGPGFRRDPGLSNAGSAIAEYQR